MKYYVEYPIPIRCDLRCDYCFHGEAWKLDEAGKSEEKYSETCAFTPRQFMKWRDKHLIGGAEFIYELHGGEPSCSYGAVMEIIDTIDKGKFRLQTHGLGDENFYRQLAMRGGKIDRIGFTYHRAVLDNGVAETNFMNNVFLVKDALEAAGHDTHIYVKELLHPQLKNKIIQNKTFWEISGVEFRIQDFKGHRGCDPVPYTSEDWELIHPEYKHEGTQCFCREQYKQVLIRGYDIFRGDVLACWKDPVVVGSILDDTYDGGYAVCRSADGGVEVTGVSKVYRGSYPGDVWTQESEELYGNFNKDQLSERKAMMEKGAFDFAQRQLDAMANELRKANEHAAYHSSEAERWRDGAKNIAGALAAYQAVVNAGNAAAKEAKDKLLANKNKKGG